MWPNFRCLEVSIAPDIVLLADPEIVRCFPVGTDPGRQLWLLTHARHRHTAHVRTALDVLGSFVSNLVRARLGEAEPPDLALSDISTKF